MAAIRLAVMIEAEAHHALLDLALRDLATWRCGGRGEAFYLVALAALERREYGHSGLAAAAAWLLGRCEIEIDDADIWRAAPDAPLALRLTMRGSEE